MTTYLESLRTAEATLRLAHAALDAARTQPGADAVAVAGLAVRARALLEDVQAVMPSPFQLIEGEAS